MTRASVAAFVSVALTGQPMIARANGERAVGPPTVFERFVRAACSPCLRGSYPVAALVVLRARQPDRPDGRSLALRVTRSVLSAPGGGEPYRLGVGLRDGAGVRALAQTIGEMAKRGMNSSAPVAGGPGAESVDVDYRGESLRIGLLRIKADTGAYGQTGDLTTLVQRAS
jgi:hypothetical protein